MTTIAYDHANQIIAIDSRRCRGDYIQSDDAKNFMVFGDGSVWFFCGVCSDFKFIVDAYNNKETGITYDIEAEALVFKAGLRRVYFADGKTNFDDDYDHSFAIGSGAQYAIAAMDFGLDAAASVEYAKTRDTHAGGKVHIFSLKTASFITERWDSCKEQMKSVL